MKSKVRDMCGEEKEKSCAKSQKNRMKMCIHCLHSVDVCTLVSLSFSLCHFNFLSLRTFTFFTHSGGVISIFNSFVLTQNPQTGKLFGVLALLFSSTFFFSFFLFLSFFLSFFASYILFMGDI